MNVAKHLQAPGFLPTLDGNILQAPGWNGAGIIHQHINIRKSGVQPFAFFNTRKIGGEGFNPHLRQRAHLIRGCGKYRRIARCQYHIAAFACEGFRASKANAF